MKTLELKDIVGYLPYKLKATTPYFETPFTIIAVDLLDPMVVDLANDNIKCKREYIINIKPILRPMSDLTKPIKVEGYNEEEEFVPILEFCDFEEDKEYALFSDLSIYFKTDKGNWVSHYKLSLEDIQLLYQWYFDINGLCDKGLAIPYKNE